MFASFLIGVASGVLTVGIALFILAKVVGRERRRKRPATTPLPELSPQQLALFDAISRTKVYTFWQQFDSIAR
jgi:voltage-gated potassium channel Kch